MYNELYHHGILGMKWGIRRYQNPDGSLTPAGRKRYSSSEARLASSMTTEELRSAINRKQLENRYSNLKANTGRNRMTNEILDTSSKALKIVGDGADVFSKSSKFTGGSVSSQHKADIVKIASTNASKGLRNSKIKKASQDLSEMSDEELRRLVDRLQLEATYEDLYGVNHVRGKEKVDKVLDVTGKAVTVTSSALAMAVAIKHLMKAR